MHNATVQTTPANEGTARGIYILAVACFPVVLAGLLSIAVFATGAVKRENSVSYKTEFAQFDYPKPGDFVSGEFELYGRVKSIPAGQTVYLAEESGGYYWPKQHLGDSPTTFKRQQSVSAGAGYKYSVVLLSVDPTGASQIEDWFETGQTTGKYPGVARIESATTLARTRIIHP